LVLKNSISLFWVVIVALSVSTISANVGYSIAALAIVARSLALE